MSQAAERTYRAALIGCGSVGSFFMDELRGHTGRQILPVGHAETLLGHPRTTLVAGADPDSDRLAAFGRRWGIRATYRDHIAMLEHEHPDIVSIASPPDLHPQQVIDCAERGVAAIFCEKPMAPTLREADAMLDACQRHGVRLAINHTLRGDPYYHQARRLIADGVIGQVLSVTMSWAGRLFLTGTHHFDLVNYLLGDEPTAWLVGHIEEPDQRQPAVATQRGIDFGGTAYLVYRNGVRAFFNGRDGTSWRRLDVIGRDGAIWIDGQDAQLYRVDPDSRFRDLLRHPYPQMMRYTAPMTYLLDDLIAAMETGGEPVSSGHTARNAVAQVIATHISSADGNRKVGFPIEDLDARAPYRWFSDAGTTAYDAGSQGSDPSKTGSDMNQGGGQ